jgi:hypothetical protein
MEVEEVFFLAGGRREVRGLLGAGGQPEQDAAAAPPSIGEPQFLDHVFYELR